MIVQSRMSQENRKRPGKLALALLCIPETFLIIIAGDSHPDQKPSKKSVNMAKVGING